LFTEFGQLCLRLWLQKCSSTILLIKLNLVQFTSLPQNRTAEYTSWVIIKVYILFILALEEMSPIYIKKPKDLPWEHKSFPTVWHIITNNDKEQLDIMKYKIEIKFFKFI
jgi:hypothetical protein